MLTLPLDYAVDLTPEQRAAMKRVLLAWLDTARKKPVLDLDTQIKEMQANIAHLVDRLSVLVVIRPTDAGYRIEPAEVDLSTWLALSRGTLWLEACDNLEALALTALA